MLPRPWALLPFLLAFLLSCALVDARKWAAPEVPNPKTHPSSCIDLAQAKQGVHDGEADLDWMWVCNPDKLLSPATVDNINQALHALSLMPQEGCQRGIQVAVLVIDRMATGSSETAAMQFAKDIHELWGVGDRNCNNGVVFLMALGDRKWYISTGVGVNKILTEYSIKHIKDNITPYLKDKEYNWAALEAVSIMNKILSTGEPYEPSWVDRLIEVLFFTGIIVVLLVAFCQVPFRYFRNVAQRRTRREERRAQLQDMERRMQQGANFVPITMCPICMEDLRPETNNADNNANNNNSDDSNTAVDVGESSTLRHRRGADAHSNAQKAREDKEMKTKLLFCGHKFHKKCINDWLVRNDSCPICRRQRPTEPDAPQVPSGAQAQAQALGADHDFFLFANQRLLYYSIWNVPRRLYMPPPSSYSGGGGGGGFSFGGGSGFGGGGGGGSW